MDGRCQDFYLSYFFLGQVKFSYSGRNELDIGIGFLHYCFKIHFHSQEFVNR